MKRIAFPLLIATVLFSCQQSPNPKSSTDILLRDSISDSIVQIPVGALDEAFASATEQYSLDLLNEHLQAKPTSFRISPLADTIIKGRAGIHCLIPKAAFVDADGNTIEGDVQLKMTECTTLASYIGHKLSTVCEGKPIETAGMTLIEAYVDGRPLQLADGKELLLFFPKQKSDFDDMQTFYGVARADGTMEWKEAMDVANSFASNSAPDSSDLLRWWKKEVKSPSTIPSAPPAIRTTEWSQGYRINLAGQSASMNHQPVLWTFKDSSMTIFERFPEEFSFENDLNMDSIYDKLEEDDRNRLIVQMKITPAGKLYGFKVKKSLHHTIDRAVVDYLRLLPELELTEPRFQSKDGCYALVFAIQKFNDQFAYARQFRKQYAAFDQRIMKDVSQLEVTNYVVASRKLGWINCDRFPEDQPLIDFVVVPSLEGQTSVHLAFSGMNAIMRGIETEEGYLFKNVPDRAKAKIIGLAINKDLPALAVEPVTISSRTIHLENYEPFSLEELDKQIAKL